jgi:hypothetical protein
MKSFGALLGLTMVAVLALAACGGGDASPGGGAGGQGGETTASTTTSTTSSTTTAATSGSGGGGGSGGFADAVDLDLGQPESGDLAEVGQEDYYRIAGEAGMALFIDVDAQVLDAAEYDPEYIDAVVTVFDANGDAIAQNNDPVEYSTNDSRLYTILPADGDYYVRVAECWTVVKNPGGNCAAPKEKTVTDYVLGVYELYDDPADSETENAETGSDPSGATDVEFLDDGGYVTSTLWGAFDDGADVDVFTVRYPTGVDVPAVSREHLYLTMFPSGPDQSGSTAPTGRVRVVDPAAPGLDLAVVDATKNLSLDVPLVPDTEYWLFVEREAGEVGANDFYFVRAYPGWGNPFEVEVAGAASNDATAAAEPLTFEDADSAYIEGELTAAPADVDHFVVSVPDGSGHVAVACGAQRNGSGLRGLKASVLKLDGSPLAAGASATEGETTSLYLANVAVGSEAHVVVLIEAASQDPAVTSDYYKCGVHFSP